MAILPISNVINVTITQTPSGFAERNVNVLGLFTTETPSNADPFREYISAAQVAEDYGTNAVTTAMAQNIFAQTPNIRTGDGQLVIMPLQASVSATEEDSVTADISANLNDILLVTDGDIRITLNGTDHDLAGLDFTSGLDFADVASIIQNALPNGVMSGTTTTIGVASKKVGAASGAIFAQLPAGVGTDLSGAGFFNVVAQVTTPGVDASGETIAEALVRLEDQIFFAGILTDLQMEDAVISTTAAAIQSRDKIFVHQGASAEDIAGIGTTIQAAAQTKTRILVYTLGIAEANLMKAAYCGRAFSVNFAGTNVSQTMNLKTLVNVVPDTSITQTLYNAANTAGTDLYVSYEGFDGTVFSTGGNDFFDNVYNDLQLKFSLEAGGFNFLRQTSTKIPQTEEGMDGLKNAYAQVLERFVRVGAVAPGSWTSFDTFGDPETFKQNVLEKGYYIFSISVVDQASGEREAREAPLVQIAVKRSGAIHSSDVIVLVND